MRVSAISRSMKRSERACCGPSVVSSCGIAAGSPSSPSARISAAMRTGSWALASSARSAAEAVRWRRRARPWIARAWTTRSSEATARVSASLLEGESISASSAMAFLRAKEWPHVA